MPVTIVFAVSAHILHYSDCYRNTKEIYILGQELLLKTADKILSWLKHWTYADFTKHGSGTFHGHLICQCTNDFRWAVSLNVTPPAPMFCYIAKWSHRGAFFVLCTFLRDCIWGTLCHGEATVLCLHHIFWSGFLLFIFKQEKIFFMQILGKNNKTPSEEHSHRAHERFLADWSPLYNYRRDTTDCISAGHLKMSSQ